MSPETALHSPVFQAYVTIVAGLLIVGGALLVFLRWRLRRPLGHAAKAYRGWLIMAPLVLLCIFLGRVPTIVFFSALSLAAFFEYARATRLIRDRAQTTVVAVGILAAAVAALGSDPFRQPPGWYGFYMALPVYVVAAILPVPIVRNRASGQLQTIALAVVGFLYIGWMFGHLALLANGRHAYGYLLFIVLAVELNDIAAYTFGRLVGKHPLRSNISPHKTWEGCLGALAVSMALPWLLRFSFPHFTPRDLILSGLIVGVGGQLGDLSISIIKRDVGVKDMGAAISGHGGVLDRIDSLIYTAPLFFHMARFFHEFD